MAAVRPALMLPDIKDETMVLSTKYSAAGNLKHIEADDALRSGGLVLLGSN